MTESKKNNVNSRKLISNKNKKTPIKKKQKKESKSKVEVEKKSNNTNKNTKSALKEIKNKKSGWWQK